MVVVHCLAFGLLVGGGATPLFDDYPVVDATVPVFGSAAVVRYVDEIPIMQDRIAQPWEPVARLPRCNCDGLAVPDGW